MKKHIKYNIEFMLNMYFVNSDKELSKQVLEQHSNHIHMMGGYDNDELVEVHDAIENNFDEIENLFKDLRGNK